MCRNCLLCGFEVVGMTRDENSSTAQALRIAGVRLYKGDVDVEHEIDRFFGAYPQKQAPEPCAAQRRRPLEPCFECASGTAVPASVLAPGVPPLRLR